MKIFDSLKLLKKLFAARCYGTFLDGLKMEGMDKITDKISKMKIVPLAESMYLKPYRAEFEMNGKQRYWDFLKIHDSVSVLIYNISRKVLVLVRQFRPAMYLSQIESVKDGSEIDHEKYDLRKGYSLELCAGIVDKNSDIENIAREEVLEECGYDIPVTSLKKLFSFRGVGITGQQSTVFYAEVTDDQKVSEGGGLREEGESIEVIEMHQPQTGFVDAHIPVVQNQILGCIFTKLAFVPNFYALGSDTHVLI